MSTSARHLNQAKLEAFLAKVVGDLGSAMSVALASRPIALGTAPPDEELNKVVLEGGFTRFRRATETPFNRVFEAKP